ncbi:MAG: oxidoreductase [Deltaproteobacteria bacterium]|nr:oxidoreductase [Deltaproteobacteria bacterium]
MTVWLALVFLLPLAGVLLLLTGFPSCFQGERASRLASLSALATLVAAGGVIVQSLGKPPAFFLFGRMPWIRTESKLFGAVLDPLSVLMLVVTVVIGFLVVFFSNGYLSSKNREHPVTSGFVRYYAWLLFFIFSMIGLALSPNLLQFLIFWELTTICSAALIAFYEDETSFRSGFKALLMTHIPGLFFIVGLAFIFVYTSSFEFASIGRLPGTIKVMVLICLLLAGWAKSAQGPFYTWIPDAMVAPTPISAYLHAAAMVKAGAFLIARVFTAGFEVGSGIGLLTATVAIITMFMGLVFYFVQDDLKRLLAYSTISNVGYIFLGLGLGAAGSLVGLRGGLLHLLCHAFAKTLLFLSVGAISYAAGTRLISRLSGLAGSSPLLAGAFITGVLSVTGIPPFSCFWSKFFIVVGAFELRSTFGVILGILVLGESVGAFIWFIVVTQRVFFGEPREAGETFAFPFAIKLVLGALVILTLAAPLLGIPFLEGVR